MTEQLSSLMIKNFRSIRGEVVVPLNAPIILVHGSNGMGKTSILSAMELALTGKVSHLQRIDPGYRRHLLHMGRTDGRICLTGAAGSPSDTDGDLLIDSTGFSGKPFLDDRDAEFFTERCYLAQATLGRLLELYEDVDTSQTSALTRFVNDLLGLDQLDALIDGLHPAFHIARIRNLVPRFRRLESLRKSVEQELDAARARAKEAEHQADSRRSALNAALRELYESTNPIHKLIHSPSELRTALESDRSAEARTLELTNTRVEVESLRARRRNLPPDLTDGERTQREQRETSLAEQLATWEDTDGRRLHDTIEGLSDLFADLPSARDNPALAHEAANQRVGKEVARCARLIREHEKSVEQMSRLDAELARLVARIDELNAQLERPARDALALAGALAAISPHIDGESCPVCRRDYSEVGHGPLAARLAANIAGLTSEAGHLQELAQQRAEASAALESARRERLVAEVKLLPPTELAALRSRNARLDEASAMLASLSASAQRGSEILRDYMNARESLASLRRRDALAEEIQVAARRWVQDLTSKKTSEFASLDDALSAALEVVTKGIDAAARRRATRNAALSELGLLEEHTAATARHLATERHATQRLEQVDEARKQVTDITSDAKRLSNAAKAARARIVGRVFNETLNQTWRDLFIRLAPSEPFIPAFEIPQEEDSRIEARLVTLDRAGARTGSPGAMLSYGNLNTAALTLFLALHLCVQKRLPWLVLDDPVQSMDDLHVSQFAALLRTFAKRLGRRVVVAVHERSLFDYLALELSPAFDGDRLITVELSRDFSGNSIAEPRVIQFETDPAIAA